MSDGERFRMEVIRDEAVVADRQIVSGRSWSCPFDDLCCTHQAAITNIVCSVSRVLTIPASDEISPHPDGPAQLSTELTQSSSPGG